MVIDREQRILAVREVIANYPTEQLPHPQIALLAEVGIRAALASAKIARAVFEGTNPTNLQIEWKQDATARTVADVEGDIAIVKVIQSLRPQDNIYIEESGFHKGVVSPQRNGESGITWDADSLDGTRAFTEFKPWSVCAVGARDDKDYLLGVVAHPFRQNLAFAIRGMGAYSASYKDNLGLKVQQMRLRDKATFAGATVAVDSYWGPANYDRKAQVLRAINMNAFMNGGFVSQDAVASNIAYQLDVAQGLTDFGITDFIPAAQGSWDWRVGEALIIEAGGVMVDPITGNRPTNVSQVVIYGNKKLVDLILPTAQAAYENYKGFIDYDFNQWRQTQSILHPEGYQGPKQ